MLVLSGGFTTGSAGNYGINWVAYDVHKEIRRRSIRESLLFIFTFKVSAVD